MLSSLLAIALSAGQMLAQPGSQVKADTTEIIIGKKVITITKDSTDHKDLNFSTLECDSTEQEAPKKFKRFDVSPIGIDLGANFITQNGQFNLPGGLEDYEIEPLRSTHVGIHVLPSRLNFGKGHVSLLTAVTFDNNRYQFRNNVLPQPGLDSLVMLRDSIEMDKNKLVTWYAQIPLMLSFQTKPGSDKGNFHISIGGYAGLFLGAKTKHVTAERGKVNFPDDFNLNQFRYGATARIGYGGLELYANYQLSNLFAPGEGPALNPFNFGIALTGFM